MRNSIYLIFLISSVCFAQNPDNTKTLKASKDLTWAGNKEIAADNFTEAEANYRRAIAKSAENSVAPYNLGNAYYKKETYNEAFTRFKEAGETAGSKSEKHKAFHNMGNVFMKNKDYQKAVDAYKEALRNIPTDEETRYNLALAKKLLEKEKQDQKKDNKDKDKEDKKDENKDQKNEGDNKEDQKDKKDQKDKGDEGDKGQEKPEENKKGDGDEKKEQQKKPNEKGDQKKQPRPNQLSPQQIKNLLEAMQNEEKKVQEKIDAQKVKGVKTKNEKDW